MSLTPDPTTRAGDRPCAELAEDRPLVDVEHCVEGQSLRIRVRSVFESTPFTLPALAREACSAVLIFYN